MVTQNQQITVIPILLPEHILLLYQHTSIWPLMSEVVAEEEMEVLDLTLVLDGVDNSVSSHTAVMDVVVKVVVPEVLVTIVLVVLM
jgi:hypothetical protein